jgi:hypothetical protein
LKFSQADSRVEMLCFSNAPSPYSGCAGMGTDLTPGMSEKLHILMQLFAGENFIEFCHHKRFNT